MPPQAKKQRPKSNIVYSQPKDTHTGKDVNTQIFTAVLYLKDNPGVTLSLQDLAIMANTPMILEDTALEKLKSQAKVQFHPATNLFSYKAEVLVDSKESIIAEMARHERKGSGVSMKVLKESWKGAAAAVDELEQDGILLVMRAGKDNNAKYVFWNDVSSMDAAQQTVDEEFKTMWHAQVVPEDADVVRALNSEGLAPTISEPIAPRQQKKKSRKGARPRQTKITNTHIEGIDLSMDYQPQAQ